MTQAATFPGTAPGHTQKSPFTSPIYGMAVPEVMMPQINRHDPDLVRVVSCQNPGKAVKFTFTSPFANKQFCLPAYERSLSHIPCDQAHAVFYDNSNSSVMRAELERILKERFTSWTLIEDRNKPETFETNASHPLYPRITHRVAAVYSTLFPEYLADADIVFNLEDDVEIGSGDFEKLWNTIHMDDRIATVIGNQRDRRTGYASTGRSIAFSFHETIASGCRDGDNLEMTFVPEKDFGVEAIGAGHAGCWMTRRNALDNIYMGDESVNGLTGPDICWGWRLNRAGRLFVINWAVECRHWYQRFGKSVSM